MMLTLRIIIQQFDNQKEITTKLTSSWYYQWKRLNNNYSRLPKPCRHLIDCITNSDFHNQAIGLIYDCIINNRSGLREIIPIIEIHK